MIVSNIEKSRIKRSVRDSKGISNGETSLPLTLILRPNEIFFYIAYKLVKSNFISISSNATITSHIGN